jgi:hypothetical protein
MKSSFYFPGYRLVNVLARPAPNDDARAVMRRSSVLPSPRGLGLFVLSLSLSLAACTPEKPAVTPDQAKPVATVSISAPPAAGPGGSDPYLPAEPYVEESFPTVETGPLAAGALALPASPAGVSPAPAVCGEYLRWKSAESPSCADRAAALAALDRALATQNAAGYDPRSKAAGNVRDASLAALESCAGLPSGLARALRADLLPVECGDVLAEPVLKAPPKDLRADVHETLFGLALAARLARAGGTPPKLEAPFTRERVQKYTSGPLAKWMNDVATAVEKMSGAAAGLHFYGGAIAAAAAGMADLRLVDTVRSAPIPDEFQKDEERRNVYYASLDESLEPRKKRGADAALVGLKRFAEVGTIADARVLEARRLLSKLYGGRRIDALDRLILPAAPAPTAATLEERLARNLPTFYAGILLDPKVATEPAVLATFAATGLPLAQRKELREGALPADAAPLVARARFALGQLYWRTTDFDEAAKALAGLSAAARTPDLKLLVGLAIGLRGGPKDAIEMMLKATLGKGSRGQRAALDALAAENGAQSGAAAFDAAYLLEITAPDNADGPFFKGLAKRYRAAAAQLTDPRQKAEAEERARSVEAIAGTIQ